MFVAYVEYSHTSFDDCFAIDRDSFFIDAEEHASGEELLQELESLLLGTTNYCSASDDTLLIRQGGDRTEYYLIGGTQYVPCSRRAAVAYLEREYICTEETEVPVSVGSPARH